MLTNPLQSVPRFHLVRRTPTFMQVLFSCSIACIAISSSNAQDFRPQPDDEINEQIQPVELSAIFDVDGQRQLNTDNLVQAFRFLAQEINSLQQQFEKHNRNFHRQPQPAFLVRNPRFGPADGGVYGGKFYPPHGRTFERPNEAVDMNLAQLPTLQNKTGGY